MSKIKQKAAETRDLVDAAVGEAKEDFRAGEATGAALAEKDLGHGAERRWAVRNTVRRGPDFYQHETKKDGAPTRAFRAGVVVGAVREVVPDRNDARQAAEDAQRRAVQLSVLRNHRLKLTNRDQPGYHGECTCGGVKWEGRRSNGKLMEQYRIHLGDVTLQILEQMEKVQVGALVRYHGKHTARHGMYWVMLRRGPVVVIRNFAGELTCKVGNVTVIKTAGQAPMNKLVRATTDPRPAERARKRREALNAELHGKVQALLDAKSKPAAEGGLLREVVAVVDGQPLWHERFDCSAIGKGHAETMKFINAVDSGFEPCPDCTQVPAKAVLEAWLEANPPAPQTDEQLEPLSVVPAS